RIAFLIGSGEQRRIAVASLRDGRVEQRFSAKVGVVFSLAASPDGNNLFYGSAGQIWRQALSGGDPVRVVAGRDAAVDPSGRYLYVRRARNNRIDLFRLPVVGGSEEPLP